VLNGTAAVGGVTLKLTSTAAGFAARTATSSSTGTYSFAGLPSGRTYVVTPSSAVYTFTTASRTLTAITTNQTGQNFAVAARKTYTVAGRVTKSGTTTGLAGATLRLTNSAGALVKTVTSGTDGSYSLTGVPAGINYTVTAALTGNTFTPATRSYTNLSANQTAQNFTTSSSSIAISGRVLLATAGLAGVTLRLTSTNTAFAARTATSGADGSYSFGSVPGGQSYTVAPSSAVYNFTPASRAYTALAASQTGQNFTVASRKSYSISGRITKAGISVVGVTVTLTNSAGAVVRTAKTDGAGNYLLTGVPAGINYTARPSLAGWTFSPVTKSYTNLSANQTGQGYSGSQ
jgi:chitinase